MSKTIPDDFPIPPKLYAIWSKGTTENPGFLPAIKEYGDSVWQASRQQTINDIADYYRKIIGNDAAEEIGSLL